MCDIPSQSPSQNPSCVSKRTETEQHRSPCTWRARKRKITKDGMRRCVTSCKGTACDTLSQESITKPDVHHKALRQYGLGRHVQGAQVDRLEQEEREGNATQAVGARHLYTAPGRRLPSRTPSKTHFLCLPFFAFLATGLAAASSARSSAAGRSAEASWASRQSLMRSATVSRLDEVDAA